MIWIVIVMILVMVMVMEIVIVNVSVILVLMVIVTVTVIVIVIVMMLISARLTILSAMVITSLLLQVAGCIVRCTFGGDSGSCICTVDGMSQSEPYAPTQLMFHVEIDTGVFDIKCNQPAVTLSSMMVPPRLRSTSCWKSITLSDASKSPCSESNTRCSLFPS